MKVDRINNLVCLNSDKAKFRESDSVALKDNDNIFVSDLGNLYQKISTAIKQTPDIRQEKITSLKQAVDNNAYQVDAKKLAAKILAEIERV